MTFRTPTGQTGKDAYVYEITRIRNAQRDLDTQLRNLLANITDELPEDATYEMSIATAKFPDATSTCDRDCIIGQLQIIANSIGHHEQQMADEIIKALR